MCRYQVKSAESLKQVAKRVYQKFVLFGTSDCPKNPLSVSFFLDAAPYLVLEQAALVFSKDLLQNLVHVGLIAAIWPAALRARPRLGGQPIQTVHISVQVCFLKVMLICNLLKFVPKCVLMTIIGFPAQIV